MRNLARAHMHTHPDTKLTHEHTPASEKPSCLQATLASTRKKKSSQTVPHWFKLQTSSRPVWLLAPPTSRRSP